jgi:hypothetical protein
VVLEHVSGTSQSRIFGTFDVELSCQAHAFVAVAPYSSMVDAVTTRLSASAWNPPANVDEMLGSTADGEYRTTSPSTSPMALHMRNLSASIDFQIRRQTSEDGRMGLEREHGRLRPHHTDQQEVEASLLPDERKHRISDGMDLRKGSINSGSKPGNPSSPRMWLWDRRLPAW